MKYFIEFSGTCVGELDVEVYTEKQMIREVETNYWVYKEERKAEVLEFIESAIPGDIFWNYLVCVNLKPEHEVKIRVGDTVECLKETIYATGKKHLEGELVVVDLNNIQFFYRNKDSYKLAIEY